MKKQQRVTGCILLGFTLTEQQFFPQHGIVRLGCWSDWLELFTHIHSTLCYTAQHIVPHCRLHQFVLLDSFLMYSPEDLPSLTASCATAGVLDEKAAASQVLGSYPEHTGALYAPHIEETLNTLLKMGNYFHCQVREQAYISLPLLFTATVQAFPAQPSGLPSANL